MLHQSAIEGYFAQQEGLLVEAVSRLVRIDSTLGPAQPGQPFGPGPAAALEAFLSLAQEWGLPGENRSGYVGTVDLNNQPDTALHILGHLDIVDAGEGWTVTAPFQPKVVDGLLYGYYPGESPYERPVDPNISEVEYALALHTDDARIYTVTVYALTADEPLLFEFIQEKTDDGRWVFTQFPFFW